LDWETRMSVKIPEIQEKSTPVFRITVEDGKIVRNISSLTTLQFVFETADKARLIKTALFETDGTDGVVIYKALKDEITGTGLWLIHFLGSNVTDNVPTERGKFKVVPNI